MVDHPPMPAFATEHVGRDQELAVDVLVADDNPNVAMQERDGIAADDLRRCFVAENAAPAAQHLLAADDRGPTRMQAADWPFARPYVLERRDIAVAHGAIEGLVAEENGI